MRWFISFRSVERHKRSKRSGFVFFSCLKDSAFTAVKRDAKVLTGYVKGHLYSVEGKPNGEPFLSKMLYKRGVRPWGGASLNKTLLCTPTGN